MTAHPKPDALWRRVLEVFRARPDCVLSISDVCDELPDAPRAHVTTKMSTLTTSRWLRREAAGVYQLERLDPGKPIVPFRYAEPAPMFPVFIVRSVRFMLRPEEVADLKRRASRRGETLEEFLDLFIESEIDNKDWDQRIADSAFEWARACDDEQRRDDMEWSFVLLMTSLTDHGCAIESHLCECCGSVNLVAADHPFGDPICPLCIARVLRAGTDVGHARGEGFCKLKRIGFCRTGRLWRPCELSALPAPAAPASQVAPIREAVPLRRAPVRTAPVRHQAAQEPPSAASAPPARAAPIHDDLDGDVASPTPDLPRAGGRGTPVF